MATILKEAFFLGPRSWLCDVRLVERLGPLPPDIHAEDNMKTIEHKNNLFITICDYEEEKGKDTQSFLNAVCPQGIPRNKANGTYP